MEEKQKAEKDLPTEFPGAKRQRRFSGDRKRSSGALFRNIEADPKDLPLSFSSGRTRSLKQTSEDVKEKLRERGSATIASDQSDTVSWKRYGEQSQRLKDLPESGQKEINPESPLQKPGYRKKQVYKKARHRPATPSLDQGFAGQAVHSAGVIVNRSIADQNGSASIEEDAAQTAEMEVRNGRYLRRTRTKRSGQRGSAPARNALRYDRSQLLSRGETKDNHKLQKKWIKRNYAKGYRTVQKSGSSMVRGSAAPRPSLKNRIRNHFSSAARKSKGGLVALGSLSLFSVIIVSALGAGGTAATEAEGAVAATTYMAEDEDILASEDEYLDLEAQLQSQIDSIETDYPGYDEYVYQIDEISHNPYHLISFLTVMFGEFRYADVENSIQGLFEKQYSMTLEEETETVTETRTIKVGESLGNVVTSGYCNCEICCGQWSGGPTASGVYPTANHTIAVDANDPFVPLGTHVVMNGKEYVVEDTGAFGRFGVQFDVYYDDHQTALNHGHKTWEAKLADSNGSEEVEITETKEKRRLKVKVSNHKLDLVIRDLLDEEQIDAYDTYNSCFGNREDLFGTENLPGEGGIAGIRYEIPPEALKDKQFKAMITEAEKYLGMDYKWGGKKPSEGFDCSGFVSWVINHCGVGWDYGSRGAEALMGLCTYVSPSEAKPGDLVFFERTYDVEGVSHVGIYVGEGIMIHCGDPIQYTNLNYQYWQNHFLCFGRLPKP